MAIKKLQKNFTTPEQSNRLLELGVPAWTADIMFDKNRRRYELIETEDDSLAETQRTLFYNDSATPHWTVGRLMELYLTYKTNNAMGLHFTSADDWGEDNIDGMCDLFSAAIRCGYMDFSKYLKVNYQPLNL